MPDSDFNIRIKTTLEGDAAKQVAQDLKQVAEAAKDWKSSLPEPKVIIEDAKAAVAEAKRIVEGADLSRGAGLATSPGDIGPSDKPFAVETKEEYLAIERTLQALQRKVTVLKAAGEATGDYEEKIRKLDAALSTEQAIDIRGSIEDEAAAQKESTKAKVAAVPPLREVTSYNKELLAVARGLRHEFPLLSHAFRLLTNPISLVVSAAGAMAMSVRKSFAEMREAMRNVKDEDTLNQVWRAVADNLNRARSAASDFQLSLEKIDAAQPTVADRLGKVTAALQRLQAFMGEKRSLEEQRALAQIDLRTKLPRTSRDFLTEPQAEALKIQVQERFKTRAAADALKFAEDELRVKRESLSIAQLEERTLQQRLALIQRIQTTEAIAGRAPEGIKKQIDEQRKAIDDLEKRLKEVRKASEEYESQGPVSTFLDYFFRGNRMGAQAARQDTAAMLERELSTRLRRESQLTRALPGYTERFATTQAERDLAEQSLTANRTFIRDTSREIPRAEAELGERRGRSKEILGLEIGNLQMRGAGAALEQFNTLTGRQNELANQLERATQQALQSMQRAGGMTVQNMLELVRNQSSIALQLQQTRKDIDLVRAQLNSTRLR